MKLFLRSIYIGGGLLVNDWKALKIYNIIFNWCPVGQHQGQRPVSNSRMLPTQRRIQDWRSGEFSMIFFCKFWLYNMRFFNRSQLNYNMQFILYSRYKIIGCVWRDIKTIPRSQEFYRAGNAPPVLKFLDPPLQRSVFHFLIDMFWSYYFKYRIK